MHSKISVCWTTGAAVSILFEITKSDTLVNFFGDNTFVRIHPVYGLSFPAFPCGRDMPRICEVGHLIYWPRR